MKEDHLCRDNRSRVAYRMIWAPILFAAAAQGPGVNQSALAIWQDTKAPC
jgi:hypothetical protein